MDELIKQLLMLANILDKSGFYKSASTIDSIIKEARETPDEIVKERFWKKVDKDSGPIKNKRLGRCWIWKGSLAKSFYGILTINRKNYSAHRLSWEWANKKKIPKGFVLIHKCDESRCVRPSHLTIGSQQTNVADRVKKDRSAKGINNGKSRLTDKDIRLIRKLRGRGMTESAIALTLNVARSTIANVLHGRTWNWLND